MFSSNSVTRIMKPVLCYTILLFLPPLYAEDSCELQKTCEKCITHSVLCAWCPLDNFDQPRCKSQNGIEENWCQGRENVLNPKSKAVKSQNQNFSSDKENFIQIRPQKIDIDIRPGDKISFTFAFKRADNYPLDLYFLFDDSSTMGPLKNQTSNQITEIYDFMYKMTKDILIGTGSFVDKNALPYTNSVNSSMVYSFINRLQLSKNIDRFKSIINEATFGENVDPQEATLDALAQVIICKKEIGWRNDSNKIVVVVTDGKYHVAGDGKWAGIIQPYDGKCYMMNNKYSKELEMDYPSVGIISHLASKEKVIILFIISDENAKSNYKYLTNIISGSKFFPGKNTLYLEKLKKMYGQILKSIQVKVNLKSDASKFKIDFDNCYNKACSAPLHSLKIQEQQNRTLQITGTLELANYYEGDNTHIEADIVFEGYKESLKLNINVIKDCNCIKQYKSPKCNLKGTLSCGICDCDDDNVDEKCIKESICTAPDTNITCSDHGYCVSKTCICTEGYEGKYCECKKCPLEADERCICECGSCRCMTGWRGDLCKCSDPPDCSAANDTMQCNNRGDCSCSNCDCHNMANWDARTKQNKYCQVSCAEESCHNKQCTILDPFVGRYLGESLTYVGIKLSQETNITYLNESESWYTCPRIRVDVGCYTYYAYRYREDTYMIDVIIQSQYDCAATYYGIGGVCLGALLLIGIGTLIAWKYITKRRDRREYERFLKENGGTSEVLNSIYKEPTTTVTNPVFKLSFRSRRPSATK